MTQEARHNKKGKLIILSGPSGAGKTTIHEKILVSKKLKGSLVRSISMTTRSKRPGEKDGREYFFVSRKMFTYKIRAGHFLEWARVFEHYYGTPFKSVQGLLKKGKNVLLCIDVQGAQQVVKKCPDAITIFIKPPSLNELKKRLLRRGTEDLQALTIRMKTAEKEMGAAKKYDYVIVNDDLTKACHQLEAFIAEQFERF